LEDSARENWKQRVKGKWVNKRDNTPKGLLSKNGVVEGERTIFGDEC